MPGVLLLSQTTRAQQGTSNLELDGASSEPRPGIKKRKRSFCSSARLKSGCQEPHPSSPPLDIEVGTFSRCPDTFCVENSCTERSGCSWALVAFSLPAALNKNVFFNIKRAGTHQDGNDRCHHRIQEDSLWVEGGFWKQIMTGGWQGRSEGDGKVPGSSRTQAVLEAETALLHFSSLSTFLGEFLGVPAAGKTFWPMFGYLIKIPLRKVNWSQGWGWRRKDTKAQQVPEGSPQCEGHSVPRQLLPAPWLLSLLVLGSAQT